MISIVFFGTPDIGLKSLEYFYNSNDFEVLAVVTQPDKPSGRGQKLTACPIKQFAQEHNIKIFQPKSIRKEPEIIGALRELKPDFFVTFAFGQILSQEVLDIPKYETINLHVSLLPKYRGPNPYFWTIRNQEQESGVTFHLIDKGLDTGAILAQEEIKIYPSDTGKSLKERTVLLARGVVCDLLNALREDVIIPLRQREDRASYFSHPEELELNFTGSAEENDALIRAIYPWGEAYFYHNDTCFAVKGHRTEIFENNTTYKEAGTITEIDSKNRTISVLCGNNKIIKFNIILYKHIDRLFTGNYIKREMKEGDIL